MAKTDVATVPEARGMAKIEPAPEIVQQVWAAIMDGEIPPEIGDPQITARAIAERIRAGSFDESMTPAESVPSWTEDVGPVIVLGFHLNKSTIVDAQGKKGVYAIVELVLQDGTIVTRSTGAYNVLCQLAKAWEEGRFPFECELQAEPTSTQGRTTYWLRPVGYVKGR